MIIGQPSKLVYKYGHMLVQGDKTERTISGDTHLVVVKDIWPARWTQAIRNGEVMSARWVELWTFSPTDIERPLAVLLVGDFEEWYVDPARN